MGLLPPFWRTESVFCGQPGHLGDHMAAAFHGSREGTSLRRAPKAELRGRLGQKVDPTLSWRGRALEPETQLGGKSLHGHFAAV